MRSKIFAAALIGLLLAAGLVLIACGTPGAGRVSLTPGTYTATAISFMGPLTVEVRTSSNAITGVRVTEHMDTPGFGEWAASIVPARIVEHQSLAVDTVTGVTITSMAIINAVEDCLRQAGADLSVFHRPIRRARVRNQTLTADVVVVGGGGAGLAAAVAASGEGATVILVEKAGFLGGNTVAARGNINAAGSRQQQNSLQSTPGLERLVTEIIEAPSVSEEHRVMQNRVRQEFEAHRRANRTHAFDSPAFHALQTWDGGDRVGVLSLIYTMTSNAANAIEWMESMGLEVSPNVGQGGGALFPRTLFTAMPNGTGYITAFSGALAGRNNYTELLETRATGLTMDRGRVTGVTAVNNLTGQQLTIRANRGVILATGGFAGNVELRQQYGGQLWPYLGPTLITTNVDTVTGDGHFFARDAGAHLINMQYIQLMQEANPITGNINDSATPFGVMGYLMVNREGNRFIREDGRRDDVCKAILNQTDGIWFMIQSSESIPDPHAARTFDGRTVAFMLENNLSGYVTADTLEELAVLIGVPPQNLVRAVAAYNAAFDAGLATCELGRALVRRIATGPWFAYPRAPAAHYTMGGVLVDAYARALRADNSVIPGLFAAGEITGVLHGTNRLGGNAFTDIIVFGRLAGQSAAAGR